MWRARLRPIVPRDKAAEITLAAGWSAEGGAAGGYPPPLHLVFASPIMAPLIGSMTRVPCEQAHKTLASCLGAAEACMIAARRAFPVIDRSAYQADEENAHG